MCTYKLLTGFKSIVLMFLWGLNWLRANLEVVSTKFSFPHREYQLKYEELVIPGRNVSDILEIVFKNYDKRIRPFYGGKYAL